MALERAGGDQVVAALAHLVDGELGAHAAPRREQVAEVHAADLLRDAVRQDRIEPRLRARSGDEAFGEGRHVEKPDVLRHVPALVADMLEVVRAAERPALAHLAGPVGRRVVVVGQRVVDVELAFRHRMAVRREPVRAFPPIDASKNGPEPLHAVVAGRRLQGPRGGALLVGIVHGEDVGVGLFVLRLEIALRRIGAEAARIDAHHVDRRLALHDPLGKLPAGAARRGHAEGMPFVQPEILQAPGRADDRRAVGRIGDGAVIDLLDADLAEGRHARDRRLDMRHQPLQVLLEELVFGVLRRPVDIADRRALLVRAEQQPARLLAHVPGGIAFAQHAHLRQPFGMALLNCRMRLGDDVLVLDRDHRHVEPDHRAGLPREVAARRDDVLAGDVALVGLHQPFAGRRLLDRR